MRFSSLLVVLEFPCVLRYSHVCLLHSRSMLSCWVGFFCILSFIYYNPSYLKLTCITEWLERLREAVGLSPANPAERYLPSLLCLQHFQDFGGLSFKTSCSDKKACCPCLGHDGGKTTCPDKAGSLGREFQCSASVSALCWVCKSLLDQGMLGGTRRIPCEQARLLL